MAIRTVDIFAIGRALGYTDAQTRSIESLDVDGSRHQITVTRFVGDPDTGNKVLPHGREGNDLYALLADDIFTYTPDPDGGMIYPNSLSRQDLMRHGNISSGIQFDHEEDIEVELPVSSTSRLYAKPSFGITDNAGNTFPLEDFYALGGSLAVSAPPRVGKVRVRVQAPSAPAIIFPMQVVNLRIADATPAAYVQLAKPVIEALKRMQW